jgi:hypothetical protein
MKVLKVNQQKFISLNGYTYGINQLQFVDDADGNKVVGLSVLDNPEFADIHEQLNQLERIDFNPIQEKE